ncbi:MAG: DNA internalization-related competence protein ComEC/Rec2, partial [Lachnospiraceae bacterium]|nr:DNA internalization-related competence protein ComEC/Rec2 [Lachnospiraceae bacterium]
LLLTGDVEAEGEEALLSYLRGGKTSGAAAKRVTYECLKVAHHGSAYSTGAAFLAETDPCFAVISAGRGNSYGHPHPELLLRLEEAGCAVFRTDENGAVTVRSDGVNYSVGTYLGN